jgi:hypothetical protein
LRPALGSGGGDSARLVHAPFRDLKRETTADVFQCELLDADQLHAHEAILCVKVHGDDLAARIPDLRAGDRGDLVREILQIYRRLKADPSGSDRYLQK